MERKTKIVFLNDSAKIAGAEKSLALLVHNLPAEKFESLVVCPPGEYESFLRDSGVSNIVTTRLYPYNKSNGAVRYLLTLQRLAHILRSAQADIIHCNSDRAAHWGIPLAYILSLYALCHIRQCRYTRFSAHLMSRAGKRVVFVAVSNAVKASLVRAGVYPDKIMVVYNGADVRLYHPGVQPSALCASKDEVVKVAMFGRIVERKRHIDAVEALALLCHEVNAHLYIVGDAWDELGVAVETRLRERVAELGLMDHVIFTGYRTDVPEIMAAMDIVLVPSLDEPFARVILEAMSMQKPVIGTFSGGTPEMIKHGIDGLLVPPKNPGALFRAILQLVREPELASILSRNGRERAVNLFSIESHVMAIMRLYEKLLRAAGRQVKPVGCPKIGKRQSQLEL